MKIRITDARIQKSMKGFFALIIGFYPLAFMYKDEYQIIPLKIEGVLSSLFTGVILNSGLLMALTNFGLRWKKMTIIMLILSAISSWFIFYLPSANPTSTLSNEGWYHLRQWLSFSALGFILIIMVLVGRHKNEN